MSGAGRSAAAKVLLLSGLIVWSASPAQAEDSDYPVEHRWTVDFEPEWSFDVAHIGASFGTAGGGIALDVADVQWKFLRTRLLSAWMDPEYGASPQAWSYLPVGVTLPPYSMPVARPYYMYHWSMSGHELGVEAGPWDDVGLGARLGGVYAPDFSAVTLAVAVGGTSEAGGVDYGDASGVRFGVAALGASFGLDGAPGVRGTVLNFHAGPFQTALVEFDVATSGESVYLTSLFPIGVTVPPEVDGWLRPFYRFHWTPLLFQPAPSAPEPTALVGLHTLGVGVGVPPDVSAAPFLRASMTTGVADGGLSATRFAIELETLYVFALLF